MLHRLVDTYLIHDKLKVLPLLHSKARVLTYAHLTAILFCLLLYPFANLFGISKDIPLLEGLVVFIGLTLFFKKNANLIVSGNLLSGVIFIILLLPVQRTGGLYSDNLLWIILSPLVALLFTNRISSLVWTAFLLGITLWLFLQEMPYVRTGQKHTMLYTADYYFVSYCSLAIAIIFIVHVFEKGRKDLTSLLVKKNKELRIQQTQLKFHRDKLIQQTSELERMSSVLKTSNSDLENFAHAASHDLKQPLRVMKSYAKLINKKEGHHLDNESMEWVNFIVQNAGRMEQLLEDLLTLARMDKNKPIPKVLELDDVLLIVCNNLRTKIAETNTTIEYKNLPSIFASQSLIIQLFQNLISNAIKFQTPNTSPIIHIETKRFNEEIIVSIKDNGIGIAPKYQEKIFNIFRRLHTQEEYEGSGIGLHTCKRIIDTMGKKIWLESELGKGTTFYFTLPVVPENLERGQQAYTPVVQER